MEYKDLPFSYVPNTFNRSSNTIYSTNSQDKIKDQVILSVDSDLSTYYTKPIVVINKNLILPFYMAKLNLRDDGRFSIITG